jgi:hypothetical protein
MGTMLRAPLFALALHALSAPAATAQSFDDCKKIIGAIERLDCFDKLPSNAAPKSPTGQPNQPPSKPTLSADEQLIAKARAAVTRQLRDPSSAQFRDLKVKSAQGGKKGVCGLVNAKNAFGGLTGPQMFSFDGEHAYLLITDAGTGNSSSMGADILAVTLGSRLEAYERFCK